MSHMTPIEPTTAPDQHDTQALPRPDSPPWHDGTGRPGDGVGVGPSALGYTGHNAESRAWEARYLKQRTRTRFAIAVAAFASVVAVGLGVMAWQLSQVSPLVSAVSELASGLGSGERDLGGSGALGGESGDAAADDSAADSGAPDAPALPEGSGERSEVPLSELPLPDAVKDFAAALGITDAEQLLDQAVANGFVSQEDADQLRAAIGLGAQAGGL